MKYVTKSLKSWNFLVKYQLLQLTLLSLLFNSVLSLLCHGYLPVEFMETATVPIIKSKTGNSSDKNNYKPIALACSNFF